MKGTETVIKTEFIIRQWSIDGFPNYFFGTDKQLYRFDARGQVKRNKRVLIGTTQGYILKRQFYSLARLRPMLRRYDPATDYPADF
ncbi:hypothetical protein [Spirosoma pomorum]